MRTQITEEEYAILLDAAEVEHQELEYELEGLVLQQSTLEEKASIDKRVLEIEKRMKHLNKMISKYNS